MKCVVAPDKSPPLGTPRGAFVPFGLKCSVVHDELLLPCLFNNTWETICVCDECGVP